jgi:hypothetical protein
MTEAEQKAESLMNKLEQLLDTNDKDPLRPLYHYTSFEGLSGILKTRQLWLTHHKYLNDPSEIEHGKKILLKAMCENIQNNPDLCRRFIYIATEIIENAYNSFTLSFCDKNDYLPAWRYYGQDGAGYSIGFKKEYFSRIKPTTDEEKRDGVLLFKVEYEQENSNQIKQIIDEANKIYPNWNEKDFDEIKPFISALCCNLITLLPCIKNPDYIDEHEWRLCLIRLYHEKDNQWYPYELPSERVIFTHRNNALSIPFLKDAKTSIPRIKSKEFDYSDIDSICIGPRLDFFTAKLAIEKILAEEGLSADMIKKIVIRKSDRAYQ